MNYTEVIKSLDNLVNNNYKTNENNCILINGGWGVGKTHTVEEWADRNKEVLNVKYISVFGKSSVREIESAIILKLLNIFDIEVNKYFKSISTAIFSKLSRILLGRTGISFEINELISNFSIEDLPSFIRENEEGSNGIANNKTIICIDDLERKTDFSITDLLGLIERAKKNYNIIVIANTEQFGEKDKEDFNIYKEKVIDYELKITEADKASQRNIVEEIFKENNLSQEQLEKIIGEYNKPHKWNKENNLRIFKKYVLLLYKTFQKLEVYIGINYFLFETDIIALSRETILGYYFSNDTINKENVRKSAKISNLEGTEVLYKLFMGESTSSENLKILIPEQQEIYKDVRFLNQVHKFRKEEVDLVLKRIKTKTEDKNLTYFISQHSIVSLYDALVSYDCNKPFKDTFIMIAEELYEPNSTNNILNKNLYEYYHSDLHSQFIGPYQDTSEFIEIITKKNIKKDEQYRIKEINNKIKIKDIRGLIDSISNYSYFDENLLNKIFELAWTSLDGENHDDAWILLKEFITVIGDHQLDQFVPQKCQNQFSLLEKKRWEYLEELSQQYVMYIESVKEAKLEQNHM